MSLLDFKNQVEIVKQEIEDNEDIEYYFTHTSVEDDKLIYTITPMDKVKTDKDTVEVPCDSAFVKGKDATVILGDKMDDLHLSSFEERYVLDDKGHKIHYKGESLGNNVYILSKDGKYHYIKLNPDRKNKDKVQVKDTESFVHAYDANFFRKDNKFYFRMSTKAKEMKMEAPKDMVSYSLGSTSFGMYMIDDEGKIIKDFKANRNMSIIKPLDDIKVDILDDDEKIESIHQGDNMHFFLKTNKNNIIPFDRRNTSKFTHKIPEKDFIYLSKQSATDLVSYFGGDPIKNQELLFDVMDKKITKNYIGNKVKMMYIQNGIIDHVKIKC